MRKLRWGVLGTGRIIGKAGMAIHQATNAEWVGIAGRMLANSQAAAEKYQVPRAYHNYQELLDDPDIEAVYIALLNHLHEEWAFKAMQAGKHVLLEKPFTLNAAEAVRLAAAAEHNQVQLLEAHVWRYQEAFQALKAMVAADKIGKLIEFSGHFSFSADPASTRWIKEWGGGSLYDLGCYLVAWSRYFMGSEPEAVDCHLTPSLVTGADQRFAGSLYFSEGRIAQISSAIDMACGSSFELRGTRGKITVAFQVDANVGTISSLSGDVRSEWSTNRMEPYKQQVEVFSAAVISGSELSFGPFDAVSGMKVIDALFAANQGKVRVTLENGSLLG